MKTINQPDSILAWNLPELAEMCKEAGATASTVIYSIDKVVEFYKDPPIIGVRQHHSTFGFPQYSARIIQPDSRGVASFGFYNYITVF